MPYSDNEKQMTLPSSLAHDPNLSFGVSNTGNLLIQGENESVLKVLLPLYSESVRCVYIDPPYNNQEKYTHYLDNGNHEIWLEKIVARLDLLAKFLSKDGSIWISIDDREVHYLKVAADKVFGRPNFITTIVWRQRTTRENRKVFSNNHEYILVYAKDANEFKSTRNSMPLTQEIIRRYKNPDNDHRGPWQSVTLNVQAGHGVPSQFYDIVSPNGRRIPPPKGRCWIYNQERMLAEIQKNNVWFGNDGNGVPRLKKFLSEVEVGLTPDTLWLGDEIGTNSMAKKHMLKLFPNQPLFDTPKPEQLIHRILQISTNLGDLVLDAYLGSGTTSVVAHKMGRRYIGIEEGEHAITHCSDRIRQVIKGESGGISNIMGWVGGGGYDFYRLNDK